MLTDSQRIVCALPHPARGLPTAGPFSVRHIAEREHITKNSAMQYHAKVTIGQRAADAVARYQESRAYPYVFLPNLFRSACVAVQT
jgi:hypothetical protein